MPDLLSLYASTQPDKPAVIDDRAGAGITTWTYAQLEAEANRLANALASLGIGRGDKVIWCGPNSPQVVAVMGATRKIGAVAVPLNYRLTAEEAQYIVVHSDASVAYVDAEYTHLFEAPADEQLGNLRHVVVYGGPPPAGMLAEDIVASASAEPPPEAAAEQAGATMIYTSGTTGKPKGAYRNTTDQSTGDCADRLHRLHPRRRLPHLGSAVPQRPERVHGSRAGAGPDDRAAAQVRPARTGSASWTPTRSARRSPRRR